MRKVALIIVVIFVGVVGAVVLDKIKTAQQTAAWNASCDEYRQKVIESGQPYLIGGWEDGVFVIRDPNGRIYEAKS